MPFVRLVVASLLILPAALWTFAAAPERPALDAWPAWRGPARDARSLESGLARSWPEGGPPLVWQTTGMGEGYTTPAIVGQRLYSMGNRDGQEWIECLEIGQAAKPLWQFAVGPIRHDGAGYPGPRSTPTLDGNRLYALGLNGDLVALDADTGKLLWRHDLVGEFGGGIPNWGYSESVLVDGPWLLCTPGGAKATLLALDKLTGKTIWESPIGDAASYSSIVKAQLAGTGQYLQFTARGLVGVDALTGKFLWRYDRPANGTANISTPLAAGDRVFAASGYGTGGGQVAIRRDGDAFQADETFFTKEMKNHHGGMILLDDRLYGSNDPGLLTCLDWQTGKVLWKNRGPGKCSLVYADGLLIARSEDGPVSLVAARDDECEVLGQFEQPHRSGRPAWPHPVVAGGRLYLRDQDVLLCYDLKPASK